MTDTQLARWLELNRILEELFPGYAPKRDITVIKFPSGRLAVLVGKDRETHRVALDPLP